MVAEREEIYSGPANGSSRVVLRWPSVESGIYGDSVNSEGVSGALGGR